MKLPNLLKLLTLMGVLLSPLVTEASSLYDFQVSGPKYADKVAAAKKLI
jgi:hypothetical protein